MPQEPIATVDSSWSAGLRALVERGSLRRYAKGTVLIHEGERSDTLFIVISGRVQSYSSDDAGREIIYGVYGPGEYLGEMSLDGGPRSASVMTLEASVCAVITRQTLHEHIAACPEFAFELLGRVIRRARLATQSTRRMALLDVYGRLVSLLDDLATLDADGRRVVRPRPTHADTAARIGCSREMVSRLLKDLTQGGYVAAEGSAWVLLQRLPARW